MVENKILAGIAVEITEVMLSYYKIAEREVDSHLKVDNSPPDNKLSPGIQANVIIMKTVESIIRAAMVDAGEKQRMIEGYSVKKLLSM